jgi:hypothetical protein
MTLGETLISVWKQVMEEGRSSAEIEGESFPVTHTRARRLRTVRFGAGGYEFDGIEQNPQTGSRWAHMAREGKRIMQYSHQRRYVANVCEGKLLRYPAWKSLDLPE